MTSLSFNNADGQVTDASFLGAMQFSIRSPNNLSPTGGSLTVSGLHVDLVHVTVQANVAGANGLASQTGVTLWTFDAPAKVFVQNALTPSPYWLGDCPIGRSPCFDMYPTKPPYPDGNNWPGGMAWLDPKQIPLNLTNWQLTDTGRTIWIQSLGLNNFGERALGSASNFATLTMSIPEPGTLALFSLGLIGLSSARRAAQGRQSMRPIRD